MSMLSQATNIVNTKSNYNELYTEIARKEINRLKLKDASNESSIVIKDKDIKNALEKLNCSLESTIGFVNDIVDYAKAFNSKYGIKVGDILKLDQGSLNVLITLSSFSPIRFTPIIIGGKDVFTDELFQCESQENFNTLDKLYEYYLEYTDDIEIFHNCIDRID